MIRAGLIKKRHPAYTLMPLGLRVLRKIEAIIREEMNSSGALEVLLPAIALDYGKNLADGISMTKDCY